MINSWKRGPSEGGREALAAPVCPLCGKANECSAALNGGFEQPCWCASVDFSQELLARVPEGLRDKACICKACAGGVQDPPILPLLGKGPRQ
jgi:hypothetical protein